MGAGWDSSELVFGSSGDHGVGGLRVLYCGGREYRRLIMGRWAVEGSDVVGRVLGLLMARG